MLQIRSDDLIFWCRDCGSLSVVMLDSSISLLQPNSVENTKKLVQELIKARKRNSSAMDRVNRMEREDFESVELDDRR